VKDDLFSLFAYSRWANARALESLRGLPPEDYTREMGGGWPSARATFVHLSSATHAWSERFAGRDRTALHKEVDLPALDDAARVLAEAEAAFDVLLAGMTPERLAAPFEWRNLKGETKRALTWVVLRHVANHGTYHRGQIASMVRRLGGKPLATDMVLWGIETFGQP
jgi:uncharacterized damage-inducible protein DinB